MKSRWSGCWWIMYLYVTLKVNVYDKINRYDAICVMSSDPNVIDALGNEIDCAS